MFYLELKTFNTHICNLYKKSKDLQQKDLQLTFAPTQFVNLLLIRLKKFSIQKQLNIVANIMREDVSNSKLCYTTSNIEDIFKKIDGDNTESMIVLIEGAPGIGKTILCKEIAYRWACEKVLHSDKLVLLVFLRDPKIQTINSVEALVQYIYKASCQSDKEIIKISRACATHLIGTGGANVTIILDGFDELSHLKGENDFILELLYKNILPLCRIVVSSRPIASKDLQKLADVKVEILGFTKENRQTYINNELKENHEKLDMLKSYLKENSIIDHLCYIPFMLSLLVRIAKDCKEELPKSLTELYTNFIICTVSQFLQKFNPSISAISNLNDLPLKFKIYFLEICKYAYNALERDEIVFTAKEIKTDFPMFADAPGSWSGLGLLKSAEYFNIEENANCTSYNFLHLSIQEYLAAYYITTLDTNQQIDLLKKCFFIDKYLNMWIMYCGLSERSLALKHFLSNRRLLTFTRWFSIDEISKDIMECKIKRFYLFQCLSEIKNNRLHKLVSPLFENGIIDLSNYTLLPKDIDTLKYILDRSSTTHWDELNLSHCNISDAGCHQLFKALSDFNRTIIFNKLNFSSNQLTIDSLEVVIDILVHCNTKVMYLSDNFNINSDAKLVYLAMEYAFKGKVQKYPLTIHVYDEESVIFNKLDKQVIIAHLEARNLIKGSYFINCKIDDDIVTTVTDKMVAGKLGQLCLWNSSTSSNTIKQIVSIMLQKEENQLFFLYENSSKANPNNVLFNFIAAEHTSITIIFFMNCSLMLHGVDDMHAKFMIFFNPLFHFKLEELTEIQISNCTISEDTVTLLSQLISESKVISKYMLLNNMFNVQLLHKLINAVNPLPSLKEIVIDHENITNNDRYAIMDELIDNHLHALIIFYSCKLRVYRCHEEQLKHRDAIISTIMKLYKKEEHIIVYEEKLTGDTEKIYDACKSLPITYILLSKTVLLLKNVKDFHVIFTLLKSFQASNISEAVFVNCVLNDKWVKVLTQTFSHCELLTKFTYLSNNLNSSVVKLLINSLKVLPLPREIIIHESNFSQADFFTIANYLNQKMTYLAVIIMNNEHVMAYKCNNKLFKDALNINFTVTSVNFVDCNIDQFTFQSLKKLLCIKTIEIFKFITNMQGVIKQVEMFDSSISSYMEAEELKVTDDQLQLHDGENMCDDLADKMASIISKHKLMESLILKNNNLGDKGVVKVAQSLYKHSKLKCINLQSNNMTEKSAEALASVISSNDRLEKLYLSNNQLQLGVIKIANALSNISSLEVLDLQNNNISYEAANILATAIKTNKSLEKLWLSGNHLRSSTVVVVDALKNISTLKQLHLNGNENISEDLTPALTSALIRNTSMETLLLSNNGLNDDGVIKIAQSLRKHSKLKVLNLQSNKLTERAAEALEPVISSNTGLKGLYLGNNQLQLGITKLTTTLKKISSLKVLDLVNNNLSEQVADGLAAAIWANSSLEKLWLSGNHLGSSTVVVVNALKEITTLKDLALNDNKNTSEELAYALASVITHNKLMERLLLSDNNLNDDGVIGIAQSLRECCKLKCINLQSNKVTERAAEALAHVISSNTGLEELYLGNNQLQLGVIKIATALNIISSLKILDLQHNNIPEQVAGNLAGAISANTSLEKLWLSGNHLGSSLVVVVNALKEILTLKELHLNDNKNRNEELAPSIRYVVTKNKLIQSLLLSNNNLNDVGVMMIDQSLCKHSQLKCINLQGNNITKKSEEVIASVISSNTRLEELDLGNNQLQLGAIKIAAALKNISSLKLLDLNNNNIPNQAADGIAAAIRGNSSLEKLRLNGNHLGSSIVVVVNALKNISTLKDLSLNDNKNRNKELPIALKSILINNTFIERLLLSDNYLNDDGVKCIAQALCKHSKLKLLDMRNNNITEEAAEALVSVISSNNGLEELYLGNNQLQVGVITIATALKNISSLKLLDLQNNGINEKGANEILAVIAANNSVERLWLNDNNLESSISVIARAFYHNSSLKELYIKNTRISEESAIDLSAIGNCNSLSVLSLSENNLQSSGFMTIAQSLIVMSSLKHLHASDINVTSTVSTELSAIIDQNLSMQEVTIDNNLLENGLIQIAESCSRLTNLKVLELSYNHIIPREVVNLASTVNKCSSLELLSLGGICMSVNENIYLSISRINNILLCKDQSCNIPKAKTMLNNELQICSEMLKIKMCQTSRMNYEHLNFMYLYWNVFINYYHIDKFKQKAEHSINHKVIVQEANENLSQIDSKAMMSSLEIIRTLRVINLENNNIDKDGATELAGHLHCNNILEQLWLKGNELYDKGASIVLQALHNLSALLILDLSFTYLSIESAYGIAVVIGNNCSLQQLWLDGNDLMTRGVVVIASALKKLSSLRILSLCSNGITDDASEEIFDVIISNFLLVDLLLSNNELQTRGVCKIAVALRKALMLRKLDLSNNQIKSHAAEELAVTLSNCTNLQQLFLCDNMLGTEGTIKIANALKCINSLQVLTLSNNNITESAADVLLNIIENNISLKIVLISGNDLQATGINLIVQLVKTVTTLQLLDVSDNNLSEEDKEKFKVVLANSYVTCTVIYN